MITINIIQKVSLLKMNKHETPEILGANHIDRYHDDEIDFSLTPWDDGYYDDWDGYKGSDDLDCIMDNYIVNPSSTIKSGKGWHEQKIIFNSDTVEKEKYNNELTQMTTKCGWFHRANFRSAHPIHNKTNTISLNISNTNILIQFQSKVTLPKKLTLNPSVTPISIYGNFLIK